MKLDVLSYLLFLGAAMFASPDTVLAQTEKPPVLQKPAIMTLAFIPATAPLFYGLSSSILAPSITLKRSDAFDDAMKAIRFLLDVELSEALKIELDRLGYKVVPIESFRRKIRTPDLVDYQKLQFVEDALLHVTITHIGARMPRNSTFYFPQLNVSGVVITNQSRSTVFDDAVYFGIDADEKDASLYVGRDGVGSYKDFEELIANASRLNESFRSAIPILAKRLAEKMHLKLK
jgi:hypothetical protein